MKRIELEKAFREHVKEVHGEKARDNFAGSELEGLCITFLQKQNVRLSPVSNGDTFKVFITKDESGVVYSIYDKDGLIVLNVTDTNRFINGLKELIEGED